MELLQLLLFGKFWYLFWLPVFLAAWLGSRAAKRRRIANPQGEFRRFLSSLNPDRRPELFKTAVPEAPAPPSKEEPAPATVDIGGHTDDESSPEQTATKGRRSRKRRRRNKTEPASKVAHA